MNADPPSWLRPLWRGGWGRNFCREKAQKAQNGFIPVNSQMNADQVPDAHDLPCRRQPPDGEPDYTPAFFRQFLLLSVSICVYLRLNCIVPAEVPPSSVSFRVFRVFRGKQSESPSIPFCAFPPRHGGRSHEGGFAASHPVPLVGSLFSIDLIFGEFGPKCR